MDKKAIILQLFFEQHKKVKDIASLIDVSSAYITKIIKTDERYDTEKLARKNATVERHRKVSFACVMRRREQKRNDNNYYILQEQHRQAAYELSGKRRLSNEKYRRWNSSAYTYCPTKVRYNFDNSLGRSADVPRYIKI